MTARTIAAVALAVALTLGAAACGGSSDGDSKDTTDLIADLEAGGMRKKQAECLARAFADAGLSNDEAKAVGKGDVAGIDPEALATYARSASACLGIKVEVPGG